MVSLAQAGPRARRGQLLDRLTEARRAWESQPPAVVDSGLLAPDAVLRAINEATDGQALLVADPGTPTPSVAAYWEIRRPGRTTIIPRGHGAMGYAIPAAVGVALARQDLPIIALTTDGSFGMACGELETAYRLQLPIIYIHLRNNCYGWIKMLQHLYAEQRYFQVDFTPSNATAIAAGFGLDAVSVASLDELAAALRHALRAGAGVTFIDVPIPEERAQVPAVAPWQDALAGKTERSFY
jgi:acetolactate synthase-1/2/3 large subunit